jgi:Raf kinase inhibitor-like YbhB/YbcL family protein
VPSRRYGLWALALAAGVVSCTGGPPTTREEKPVEAPERMTVTSTAFTDGEPIPRRFTCDGDAGVPPLAWEGVPKTAAALALIVDDPDAPRGTFVHWVVLDLPAATRSVDGAGALPTSAVQGKNSAGRASYFPPCPPSGTHRYRFTVYALSERTGLRDGTELEKALRAVASSATAQGRLVGTYERR